MLSTPVNKATEQNLQLQQCPTLYIMRTYKVVYHIVTLKPPNVKAIVVLSLECISSYFLKCSVLNWCAGSSLFCCNAIYDYVLKGS